MNDGKQSKPLTRKEVLGWASIVSVILAVGLAFIAGSEHERSTLDAVVDSSLNYSESARPADVVPPSPMSLGAPLAESQVGVVNIETGSVEHGDRSMGTGVVVGSMAIDNGRRLRFTVILTAKHVVNHAGFILIRPAAGGPNRFGWDFDDGYGFVQPVIVNRVSEPDQALIAVPVTSAGDFAPRSIAPLPADDARLSVEGYGGVGFARGGTPTLKAAVAQHGAYVNIDPSFHKLDRYQVFTLNDWIFCPKCTHGDSGAPVFTSKGEVVGIDLGAVSGNPQPNMHRIAEASVVCKLLFEVPRMTLPEETVRTCSHYAARRITKIGAEL